MICFGIISYLPDGEKGRQRFRILQKFLEDIDTYFHLPVIILALNWEDKVNEELPGDVTLYLSPKLGIIKARIRLREILLSLAYDTYILSDDDTKLICTQDGVDRYLDAIKMNPNKVGTFHLCFLRMIAIPRNMMELMNFNFIRDLQPESGQVWEDLAYIKTYKAIYPDKFYKLSDLGVSELFTPSEKDELSTWYDSTIVQGIQLRTRLVYIEWINSIYNRPVGRKVIGIISYLPDGDLRQRRIVTLERTLKFFNDKLPNVPIIVVALNWKDFKPKSKCKVYSFKLRLGILGARRKMRQIFLDSSYDILITSDDDITVSFDDTYLDLIDLHSGCACLVENSTGLSLTAFPRSIVKELRIPFLDVNDTYNFFEDLYLNKVIILHFPVYMLKNVKDSTLQMQGNNSTWWDSSKNFKEFLNNTYTLIDNYS